MCYLKNDTKFIYMKLWDEPSIIPSRAIEMVAELLEDLFNDKSPFGGKFVIFGEVLSVIKYALLAKIVNSTLKSTSV